MLRAMAFAACFVSSLMTPAARADSPHQILYSFGVRPGESHTFPLPAVGFPVRVMISLTANNGGTQTPSELVAAVVNEDPVSLQLTWIGTNGDGSPTAGTTLGTAPVASFAFNNAVLTAAAGTGTTHGSLTITQSATQTAVGCRYRVSLEY